MGWVMSKTLHGLASCKTGSGTMSENYTGETSLGAKNCFSTEDFSNQQKTKLCSGLLSYQ